MDCGKANDLSGRQNVRKAVPDGDQIVFLINNEDENSVTVKGFSRSRTQ